MTEQVVIIGAGPAGLLLAHYLLRRGHYRIAIYDRLADPRLVERSHDRTFPISLQERGKKALRTIPGLEDAIAAEGVFCQGTLSYRKNGQPRHFPRKTPILSIDRNRLVAVLLQQLIETYSPEQVQVTFDCLCLAVDAVNHRVMLQPKPGDRVIVSYDRLIGADGARSRIRACLVHEVGLHSESDYVADAYKSVFVSRFNPAAGLALAPDKLHTWTINKTTRMILVPQPNDRLSGTIIFNAAHNPFEGMTTSQDVLAYFQAQVPLVGQLMTPDEAEALRQRPVARVLTVRCDRFHQGDRILLIGDAAHAVSPSIGQGCNASLEDVLVFDRLLDQHHDDWSAALPTFSQQRVPDAHALRELSDYSFPRTPLLMGEFMVRLTLGRQLHEWFPKWVKPFVFDLLLDTDLSYAQVLALSQGWIDKVKRSQPEHS